MKIITRIISAVALAGAVVVSISGCSVSDPEFKAQSAKANTAIDQLYKIVAPGYEAGDIQRARYSLDIQDPNAYFSQSKTSSASEAEECKIFIGYGLKLKATSFSVDLDGPEISLSESRPQAQIACVSALALDPEPGISSVGSVMFSLFGAIPEGSKGVPFRLVFNRSLSKPETKHAHFDMSSPKLYVVAVSTVVQVQPNLSAPSWSDAQSKMDRQRQAYLEALNLIGDYRHQHPGAGLYSQSSLDIALKSWPKSFPHTKLEYVRNKAGEIKVLRVSPKGTSNSLPICVSIVKYDSKFYGVADPHGGYSLGFVKQIDDSSEFGQATTNPC